MKHLITLKEDKRQPLKEIPCPICSGSGLVFDRKRDMYRECVIKHSSPGMVLSTRVKPNFDRPTKKYLKNLRK